MFEITDATIKTGVFRPKGYDSIWLFVTEKKTPDRTQYVDLLNGDMLEWQGQTEGRTDGLIIEHEARGLEILVFYRKNKGEHPGAGFRYEGRFRSISHAGAHPTRFALQHIS
jgi:putative restriction endonuclease